MNSSQIVPLTERQEADYIAKCQGHQYDPITDVGLRITSIVNFSGRGLMDYSAAVMYIEELQKYCDITIKLKDEIPLPLAGSDLTRKLLADGRKAILCYVSEDYDQEGVGSLRVRLIRSFDGKFFRTIGGSPHKYAVQCTDYDYASEFSNAT